MVWLCLVLGCFGIEVLWFVRGRSFVLSALVKAHDLEEERRNELCFIHRTFEHVVFKKCNSERNDPVECTITLPKATSENE